MLYRLTKCNEKYFELYTESLENILQILELHINCTWFTNKLSTKDKIIDLLNTEHPQCNMFILEEVINPNKYYSVINEHIDFSAFQ